MLAWPYPTRLNSPVNEKRDQCCATGKMSPPRRILGPPTPKEAHHARSGGDGRGVIESLWQICVIFPVAQQEKTPRISRSFFSSFCVDIPNKDSVCLDAPDEVLPPWFPPPGANHMEFRWAAVIALWT